MSIGLKEKINKIFDELPIENQTEVVDFAEFLRQKKLNQFGSIQKKKRVFGLHEGQGWISDDFTAPLPDEFWLGEDTEVKT